MDFTSDQGICWVHRSPHTGRDFVTHLRYWTSKRDGESGEILQEYVERKRTKLIILL